jgi:hypothetical protein
MKKIIDGVIALIAAIIISILFVLLLEHSVFGQISFIKKLSDGNFRLLILGILYCILYPSFAMMAGGVVGFSLVGIGNWFQSRMVVLITCSLIFGVASLYIIGNLWYQTVPVIWSNISLTNFFLYTSGAVTCLFDLTGSIIISFCVYYYLFFEEAK